MKPGTWRKIHQFIDFFLSFYYLDKYFRTSCRMIQDCWTAYCCLPCAPDNCWRWFFLMIESTVILGWADCLRGNYLLNESTVILGCAGTAGFSGDFDLDSAELDLSPWRAAASVRKSQLNHRPGFFWVFFHLKEVCPQIQDPPHLPHCSDLPRLHWLHWFLPDNVRISKETQVRAKTTCFLVSAFPMKVFSSPCPGGGRTLMVQ